MIAQSAYDFLKRDPVLARILPDAPLPQQQPRADIYFHLVRAIVGQQLSVKAADTICGRFLALFDREYPDPKALVAIETEALRGAGLSGQKAKYVKNVAAFALEHDLATVKNMGDDEALAFMTQIKGVGEWTAQMILMFSLARADIFPAGDQGVVNAMTRLYQIEERGKDRRQLCIALAESWRPYRSYACIYLWRWLDNQPKIQKEEA
ncbi:DNA-3-methyladenine glycosylase family protein [Acanthopleuribacter pedis]|uniref:DNA-3-methyladenine glycosylase II n=1 Tax=Acanthopleuribacter pedis TaxID=442870 RepID=A0A8J7QKY5_9BACT|nr:DNA-3-methyladenine glycosylase 2 family protein [Acanthopleuribacter pedis]MBO1321815.1 DNA-3-methyladenine glycosylase 2 family protein [Acanthopleuribacter pedis]